MSVQAMPITGILPFVDEGVTLSVGEMNFESMDPIANQEGKTSQQSGMIMLTCSQRLG